MYAAASEESSSLAQAAERLMARLRPYFPPMWLAILVPLAYVGAAATASYLGNAASMGPLPIYPATAIVLVALIRNRLSTWPYFVFSVAAASLISNYTDTMMIAFTITMSLVEALLIASLLRRFTDVDSWYLSARWFVLFVAFTLMGLLTILGAIAAVIFAIGHPIGAMLTPLRFVMTLFSIAISIVLATPLLLSWTEPALRHNIRSWQLAQAVAMIVVIAGAASAAFLYSNSIAPLFLIFPLLGLLTLRTGLPGATAGAVAITAVGALLTAKGIGPIASYPGLDWGGRILFLQLYFVAASLSSIPIAVILAVRAALSEEVKQQGAISDAALSNMAQGLSMFDRHDRLIICNQHFAELYDLPDFLTKPLTPLHDIAAHHRNGSLSAEKLKAYLRELMETSDPSRSKSEIKLPDGRIISIHCRLLEDGSWVATHEDVTEQRLAEARVSFMANHDPLTGLSNRTHFSEQLQILFARVERGHAFALHALDLDRFKSVNDSFGHAAGDELLQQVAARLKAIVRSGDVITRLGGDEFAILQYSLVKPDEASALAARIVEALGRPFLIGGHEVGIGASIGIALAPGDTSDPEELMQKSDLALYRAKADGRNAYRFYEQEMNAAQQARRSIKSEMQSAIQNGEFELYYQPIVDTEARTIRCFEALIRWLHPTRGLIAPAEFIGVAEENGLIQPIGEFVLQTACREAATWPDHVKVAVNLSPTQFKSRNIVAIVKSALADAKLEPHRLELEITETLLLQNREFALKCLHQFRDMGIGIAMDDFGTGYSSLSYLRSFPFDKIKIDRSFVAEILTKDDSFAIVHAAIGLSDKLGMTSTAEGVETAEEYAALQAQGCTNIQGYYISRPLPASRVLGFLERHSGGLPSRLALVSCADTDMDCVGTLTRGRFTRTSSLGSMM